MNSFIEKVNSYRYSKQLIITAVLVLSYLTYQIYDWMLTQSTDNAYVEADISNISAEVNGVIEEVLVKENNFVEEGQIVARIKDDMYKAYLTKSEAALEAAKIDVEIIVKNIKLSTIERYKSEEAYQFAQENFKVYQSDYNRVLKLSEDNYASKKNLDSVKILLEKTKTELTQAKFNMQTTNENLALLEIKRLAAIAKVTTAIAEQQLALRDFNNTLLRAPISGVLGNSSLREGNYVRTGVVLYSVVPINKLYIKANFKETQIFKFKLGMKALISVDSLRGEKIEGVIRNISPATGSKFSLIPPSNATGNFTKIVQRVPVVIDFNIPEYMRGKIVPGMSVIVKIKAD